MANVKNFQKIGNIHNLPRVVTKVSKRVERANNQLTDLIQEFSELSIRKASGVVRRSFGCVRSFLKEDLHLKPCKEHEFRLLKPNDTKIIEFGEHFIDKCHHIPLI